MTSRPFKPLTAPAVAVLTLALIAMCLTPAAATAAKRDNGVINGTVTSLDGKPVPGVLVTITSVETSEVAAEATGDAEGRFSVKIKNASGTYKVLVSGMGYEPFEIELPLAGGEEQNVTFKLVDQASGKLRDAVLAFNEGAKAFEEEDLAAAKTHFERALELDPTLPQAYLGLGDILYRETEFAAARNAVEKLLELDPDNVQGRRLAYEIYRQLDEDELADQTLAAMQGSDLAPKLAVQTYNEGVAALQGGDEVGAVERFQEALELNPNLVEAHAALATLYYNQERYDEALATADRLLELEAQNAQALRIRFLVYDALNDQQKIGAALEAYKAVAPDAAADILYRRADLDYRAGEVAAAKKALLQVVEMRPELARAHYTLGLCYISEGNNAKAKEHLETFLELAPDDSEAGAAREMLSYL